MYYFYVFLTFFISLSSTQASFLDPLNLFEPYDTLPSIKAGQKPEYNNICLIRKYDAEGKLRNRSTGALVIEDETKKFYLLTAAHVASLADMPAGRLTATFDDGKEREIKSCYLMPDLQEKNKRINPSERPMEKGDDIAVAFLESYPQNISPACLAPPQDIKTLQEEPGTVVGYGLLLEPYALKKPKCLFSIPYYYYYAPIRSLMTLKVSYDERAEGKFGLSANRLKAVFKDPSSPEATPFEQPLRDGFSGAPLLIGISKLLVLLQEASIILCLKTCKTLTRIRYGLRDWQNFIALQRNITIHLIISGLWQQ